MNLRAMGPRELTKAAWAKAVFEWVFPTFERLGLHVLPVHFYSPVPDTRQLRQRLDRWHREWAFSGIDFDVQRQRDLVERLRAFRAELERLPSQAEVAARGLGEGYCEVESRVLHAMLRTLKPSTVVEVGSGVSTWFSANALSLNRRDGKGGRIVCIEPRPRRALAALPAVTDVPLEIIASPVQDVELELFEKLDEGDILFIDSSHVAKLDSDVDRLYLEILPSLRPGVFIHVHDIPFPYLAPDPRHWVFKKHRFWNEASLLAAFLAFNSTFQITLALSYLHHKHHGTLSMLFPYDPVVHEPSSLWLERVR